LIEANRNIDMKRLIPIVAGVMAFGLAEASGADKVDFKKEILPILQKSCIECHGPEKQKGKLRLDSKEAALKAGKESPVITPGDAMKSELYRRITLPAGHDDIMPNKGEPLSKAQTDLFRDWINQGAEWPETALAKGSGEAATEKKLPEHKPSAAELKAIADLEALGVSARPIAMNLNWRQANFYPLGTNATDKAIVPVKDIIGLVELNLAGTKITDSGLANLANLTNLTRLHLEKTEITDAGLAHLKGLKNLSYLNLYGTPISDAGLEHLKGLTNLKNIYLWQTKVTDAGVTNLQQVLPKLDVSRGWELTVSTKTNEKEKEKEKEEPKK
jgi:hypothetical protein